MGSKEFGSFYGQISQYARSLSSSRILMYRWVNTTLICCINLDPFFVSYTRLCDRLESALKQ